MTAAAHAPARAVEARHAQVYPPPRGKGRADRADLVAAFGWVSTAFAVTLYLADGALGKFTSLSSSLYALGVIAGLVATNAMLYMLLLAARVPVIDRAIGQVKATQWHKQLGQITVMGVLAHVLFTVGGLAVANAEGLWGAITLLWSNDLALALAAVVLLLVISVTSVVAVRRKLRYEVWHIIHLLSYIAVAFAIPHMFSMGSMMLPGMWQRTYWATLLLAVGVALLAYRVLLPLYRSWRHDLRLVEVHRISPNSYHLTFRGRHLDRLAVEGGQYFNWRLLDKKLWTHQHPFSLSAAPHDDTLRVTVRVVGDGTSELVAAKPGTRVFIEGPYGGFTDSARTQEGLLLIGAGSGAAPIYSMLESTTADPATTVVVLRASQPEDVMMEQEFRTYCAERGIALHILIGPRHEGRWVNSHYAVHTLGSLVGDLKSCDVFVCGPTGFIDAVVAEAQELGLPDEQIHEERFGW